MAMAVAGMSLEELTEYLDKKVDERLESKLQSPSPPHPHPSSPRHHQPYQRHSPTGVNFSAPHRPPYPRHHSPSGGNYRYPPLPTHTSPGYSYPTWSSDGKSPQQGFSGVRQPGQRFTSPIKQQYRGPRASIQSVKIMITYVETACIFWGQVLNADIVDATNRLDNNLQEMCPILPPVTTHIGKGSVYGTLWQDKWYRCITCKMLDEDNNTEVLFVDFGNKEKRNMSQLVSLRSPKFLDVPFFACPFRFPKLIAVPEKNIEAIAEFDTESILTGFVAQTPSPAEYTNIFVNRPNLNSHPMATTYNDLMIELGYAKKTMAEEDDNIQYPQPHYYLQSMQQRIRRLYDLLKQKESIISKFQNEGAQSPPDTTSLGPSQDIRYPVDENFGEVKPSESAGDKPSNGVCEAQNDFESNKFPKSDEVSRNGVHDSVSDNVSSALSCELSDVKLEGIDDHVSLEDQFQEYLIELSSELKRLECQSTSRDISNSCQTFGLLYDQIKSLSVNSGLIELKSSVDSCFKSLDLVSSKISCSQDSSSLQSAVTIRNDNLQKVANLTDAYSTFLDETHLREKIQNINTLLKEAKDTNNQPTVPTPLQSTEELLDMLAVLEESYKQSVTDLECQYSEQLATLSNIFSSCATVFEEHKSSASTGEASSTDNGASESEDAKHILDKLGEALRSTRIVTSQLNDAASQYADQLTPLTRRLHASLNASGVLSELNEYIRCEEEYKRRARLAGEVLANKPDVTAIKDLKTKIRAAKRQVKLEQIKDEDEEDSEYPDSLKIAMLQLHNLYKEEEAELEKVIQLAQTTHPELFIEHPQLLSINRGGGLIKVGWSLQEFVMPDTAACINNQGHNVYLGFYGDKEIYLVERPLVSLEGDLEDKALSLFNNSLPGCFAIIVDKKSLKAFGATYEVPEDC